MSDNLDLAERIDAAIGEAPTPLPLPRDRVAAGRRALLRRRLAVGAGALAVVAVVGSAFALVGGDSETRVDPASPPSAEADGTGSEPEPGRPSDPDADVELTREGELLVAEGVEVTRQVENPLGLTPPDYSLGIAYTRDGETTWALLESSGSVTYDPARKAFATLDDWLDEMVALETGDVRLQLVEFGVGETLEPLPGVEIVDQTGEVNLSESFAGPRDRTAAAQVTYEGKRWFVLARQISGSPPEYFPTAGRVGGQDLADFLDYASGQYTDSGGEGLR